MAHKNKTKDMAHKIQKFFISGMEKHTHHTF